MHNTLNAVGQRMGLALAVGSFLLNALWVVAVVPLDAPDEPAHLQAVVEVRNKHILPEIHYDFSDPEGKVVGTPGDRAVQDYTVAQGFYHPYDSIPYESMQPPLYYLVVGLAAHAVPSTPQVALYLGRLISALFGAGAVFFIWAAVREFAPSAPRWAFLAAGTVALLPQFCFNSATAANDSIANFFSALLFFVWIKGLRQPTYDSLLLKAGAVLGLALLSKLTAVALIPGMALVILFRISNENAGSGRGVHLKRALPLVAGAAASTFAVCGWWLVRNVFVYGEPTGSSAALKFYAITFPHFDLSSQSSVSWFLYGSWTSAWGRFGWMDFQMPDEFYTQALVITSALVSLSILFGIKATRRRFQTGARKSGVPAYMWQAVAIMGVVVVSLMVGYLQFNLSVALQPQGRYFFTALLPMAMLFTGGLYALASLPAPKAIAKRFPSLWMALSNFPLLWLGAANLSALILLRSA